MSLVNFVWFRYQLGGVGWRGGELLDCCGGLLVVEIVMAVCVLRFLPQDAVLFLGIFGVVGEFSGFGGVCVDVFLVMCVVIVEVVVVVVLVVMVTMVVMVARLLVVLHHNASDAIQPDTVQQPF